MYASFINTSHSPSPHTTSYYFTPHQSTLIRSIFTTPLQFSPLKTICVPSTRTVSHDRWVVYYIKRFQHNYNLMIQLNKKIILEIHSSSLFSKFQVIENSFMILTIFDLFLKHKITSENLMNRCGDQNEWRGVLEKRFSIISALKLPQLRLNSSSENDKNSNLKHEKKLFNQIWWG